MARLHVVNFGARAANAGESSSARAAARGAAFGVLGIGLTCATGCAFALRGLGEDGGEGASTNTLSHKEIDAAYALPDSGTDGAPGEGSDPQQQDPNTERDEMGKPVDRDHPGKWEALGREAKSLLQLEVHDGARLQVGSPLVATNSKYFGFNHHVWMGTSQLGPNTRGMYELTSQLQTEDVIMIGRLDSMFRLTGRCIGMLPFLSKNLMGKLIFTLAPNSGMQEQCVAQADYTGSDFSIASELALEYGRISYLQSVFPNFSMGAELIHAFANGKTPISFVASYKGDTEKYNASFQSMGLLTMSYANKLSKNFDFATEMGINLVETKAQTSVGLQYSMLDHAKGVYNVSCDNALNVSVTYSSELNPGVRMAFCAGASHLKAPASYTFGMSMQIG